MNSPNGTFEIQRPNQKERKSELVACPQFASPDGSPHSRKSIGLKGPFSPIEVTVDSPRGRPIQNPRLIAQMNQSRNSVQFHQCSRSIETFDLKFVLTYVRPQSIIQSVQKRLFRGTDTESKSVQTELVFDKSRKKWARRISIDSKESDSAEIESLE